MTAHPAESRATPDLPVRVWGMAADGRTFFQQARAGNITKDSALLSGIEHELKVGDTIGVQYGANKARCTVTWVINAGAPQKLQVGVQLASNQECPWKAELSTTGKTASTSLQNRRRWARHKMSFPMELRDERVNTPIRVNASDVSGNGCYVETILPIPIGTNLKVDFWIESEKITTSAIVRTCDPGVGMGIEFIGLSPHDRERFHKHLDKLDPRISGSAEHDNASH